MDGYVLVTNEWRNSASALSADSLTSLYQCVQFSVLLAVM